MKKLLSDRLPINMQDVTDGGSAPIILCLDRKEVDEQL